MELELDEKAFHLLSLFEDVTGVVPKDVYYTEGSNGTYYFFLVDKRDVKRAVGREGKNARKLSKMLKGNVFIYAFSDDLEEFARLFFNNVRILSLDVREGASDRAVFLTIDVKDKSKALGKEKKRLEAAKYFFSKFFGALPYIKPKKPAYSAGVLP